MISTTCPRCGAAVVSVQLGAAAAELRRVSLHASVSVHDVWTLRVPLRAIARRTAPRGCVVAIDRDGRAFVGARAIVQGRPQPQPNVDSVLVQGARLEHDLGCPGAPQRERLGPVPPGERSTCSSCGRPVYWIRTAATGAHAPLDTDAHVGARLDAEARREHAGRPGFVVGFDHDGEQIAILESDEALFGPDPERIATVWRSHFATCPNAGALQRRGR